jgi:hypothetical protein
MRRLINFRVSWCWIHTEATPNHDRHCPRSCVDRGPFNPTHLCRRKAARAPARRVALPPLEKARPPSRQAFRTRSSIAIQAEPARIEPDHALRKPAFPPRSEGIEAKAREQDVFIPLRRAPDTGEAEFLGEGILQAAREPSKGTLIDSVPETARDLPDQFDVVGADGGELGPAPGVVERRITNTDEMVRPKRREARLGFWTSSPA